MNLKHWTTLLLAGAALAFLLPAETSAQYVIDFESGDIGALTDSLSNSVTTRKWDSEAGDLAVSVEMIDGDYAYRLTGTQEADGGGSWFGWGTGVNPSAPVDLSGYAGGTLSFDARLGTPGYYDKWVVTTAWATDEHSGWGNTDTYFTPTDNWQTFSFSLDFFLGGGTFDITQFGEFQFGQQDGDSADDGAAIWDIDLLIDNVTVSGGSDVSDWSLY